MIGYKQSIQLEPASAAAGSHSNNDNQQSEGQL